jgi:hypothetical protein
METKGLKVYSVFLKDSLDENKSKRFTCIAMCTERAIGLTRKHVESSGWKQFDVDQITCLGDVDIMDLQFFGECEVAKCQS